MLEHEFSQEDKAVVDELSSLVEQVDNLHANHQVHLNKARFYDNFLFSTMKYWWTPIPVLLSLFSVFSILHDPHVHGGPYLALILLSIMISFAMTGAVCLLFSAVPSWKILPMGFRYRRKSRQFITEAEELDRKIDILVKKPELHYEMVWKLDHVLHELVLTHGTDFVDYLKAEDKANIIHLKGYLQKACIDSDRNKIWDYSRNIHKLPETIEKLYTQFKEEKRLKEQKQSFQHSYENYIQKDGRTVYQDKDLKSIL